MPERSLGPMPPSESPALFGGASWARVLTLVAGPLLGLAAFAAVGNVPLEALPADGKVMLGIFVLAAVYWITSAIPPFATGLLVIGLGALLVGFPAEVGRPFDVDATGSKVHSWTDFVAPAAAPVVILMLGGFVLSHAAHLTGIDRILARHVLRPFSRSPRLLVLGVLLVSGWLSMWMSNTATAAMVAVMLTPLMERLPAASRYGRGLLLAVPIGANLGGIGTPIGTPPNAIAFGALRAAGVDITFLGWMAFALPLAIVLLLIAWGVLILLYPPGEGDNIGLDELKPKHREMNWKTIVTAITFTVTIGLWVTGPWTHLPVGAVALVPLVVFPVFGLLTAAQINQLEWNILILIVGGLALGKGMEDTGLASWLVASLPLQGLPPVAVISAVLGATLILSTLMSNTATANLLTPIAIGAAVGVGLGPAQAGIAVALGASLAMGLPVSTPPNAIAFSSGRLKATDFMKSGAAIGLLGGALSVAVCLIWL